MHEATKILGVSLKTLQRWDKAGEIKIVRTPGGRRRVPESELKRLLGERNQSQLAGCLRCIPAYLPMNRRLKVTWTGKWSR